MCELFIKSVCVHVCLNVCACVRVQCYGTISDVTELLKLK